MTTRETVNYKNGKHCIIENCPFTDIDLHHTDYIKNTGVYVCHLHHFIHYHLDRVRLWQIITMMIERKMKSMIIDSDEYKITIQIKPEPPDPSPLQGSIRPT